jgi:ribosomal protein S27AE
MLSYPCDQKVGEGCMPNLFNWPCPSCGAALEVAAEMSRITCDKCGDEHIINRIGDKFTLVPVKKNKKKLETGFDRTASDEALAKLKEELKK